MKALSPRRIYLIGAIVAAIAISALTASQVLRAVELSQESTGFRSVELDIAELSPVGEAGGYAMPASGSSGGCACGSTQYCTGKDNENCTWQCNTCPPPPPPPPPPNIDPDPRGVWGEYGWGEPVKISFDLDNDGSAFSTSFQQDVEIRWPDGSLETRQNVRLVNGMGANQQNNPLIDLTLLPGYFLSGQYSARMFADRNNAVSESNESNNRSEWGTFIVGEPGLWLRVDPAGPIDPVTSANNDPTPSINVTSGQNLDIDWWVLNVGGDGCEESWSGTTVGIAQNGTVYGTDSAAPVSGTQTFTVTCRDVGSLGAVYETTASIDITTLSTGPNLISLNLAPDQPGGYTIGGTAQITASAYNTGTNAAGSFTDAFRWRRDGGAWTTLSSVAHASLNPSTASPVESGSISGLQVGTYEVEHCVDVTSALTFPAPTPGDVTEGSDSDNCSTTSFAVTDSVVSGQCGTANGRTYGFSENFPGSYSLCSAGNAVGAASPAPGASDSWTCAGVNGGADVMCSASRAATAPPSGNYCSDPEFGASPVIIRSGDTTTITWQNPSDVHECSLMRGQVVEGSSSTSTSACSDDLHSEDVQLFNTTTFTLVCTDPNGVEPDYTDTVTVQVFNYDQN